MSEQDCFAPINIGAELKRGPVRNPELLELVLHLKDKLFFGEKFIFFGNSSLESLVFLTGWQRNCSYSNAGDTSRTNLRLAPSASISLHLPPVHPRPSFVVISTTSTAPSLLLNQHVLQVNEQTHPSSSSGRRWHPSMKGGDAKWKQQSHHFWFAQPAQSLQLNACLQSSWQGRSGRSVNHGRAAMKWQESLAYISNSPALSY